MYIYDYTSSEVAPLNLIEANSYQVRCTSVDVDLTYARVKPLACEIGITSYPLSISIVRR